MIARRRSDGDRHSISGWLNRRTGSVAQAEVTRKKEREQEVEIGHGRRRQTVACVRNGDSARGSIWRRQMRRWSDSVRRYRLECQLRRGISFIQ